MLQQIQAPLQQTGCLKNHLVVLCKLFLHSCLWLIKLTTTVVLVLAIAKVPESAVCHWYHGSQHTNNAQQESASAVGSFHQTRVTIIFMISTMVRVYILLKS